MLGEGLSAARRVGAAVEQPQAAHPDRRKTWLACDEHRDRLADFLGARGFLKDVVAAADAPVDPGPSATDR